MQLDSKRQAQFWAKVNKTDTCWIWTGTKSQKGYGLIQIAHKKTRTHRIAYEILVGPIPDGFMLDHLCRNPPCLNPEHLEVVTSRENTIRGVKFRKDNGIPMNSYMRFGGPKPFCKYGHPLSGDNLYISPKGMRQCKACSKENAKKHQKTPGFRIYQNEWRRKKKLSLTQRDQIKLEDL